MARNVTGSIHPTQNIFLEKINWAAEITQTFVNNSSDTLVQGDVVELDGEMLVTKQENSYPIGIVVNEAKSGEEVVVWMKDYAAVSNGVNASEANDLVYDTLVKIVSTNPVKFEEAAANDFAVGIVLKGALANGSVKVGLFRSFVKKA